MLRDLREKVGLQVTLTEGNKLEFGQDVDLDQMSVRSMADLAVVAADPELSLGDESAYFMYRNVHRIGDEAKLAEHNQRFDLTVIPAGRLGEEYIKTSGHYHPLKGETGVEYPELYYVVSGQATYLMQKHETDGTISDVILARVPAGTAIVMPPFYGHVTINELDETLVMANWVESSFSSIYGDFEKKRGGAYYLMAGEQASYVKNPNYDDIPELRIMSSWPQAILNLGELPIYDYSEHLQDIELIAKPELFMEDFTIEKLFRM